jgi:hypothetical protein
MRPTAVVTATAATALPALALAVLGGSHPAVLTPESASWWRDLHVIGLVLFPLLALGPIAVVHVARPVGPVGWVLDGLAAVLGLVYAGFYGALDALAGIGGGHQTVTLGPGPWVASLFGIADELGIVGSYAYLAATVLAAVLALLRAPGTWRLLALVGAIFAVVGAWSFLTSHIYWPFGVATMVMLAIGDTLLVVATTRHVAVGAGDPSPSLGGTAQVPSRLDTRPRTRREPQR